MIGSKKEKTNSKTTASNTDAAMMSQLLGLATYTPHDKFRKDQHDEILTHAREIIPGPSNVGGKFRKAESVLWAGENQEMWKVALATEEQDVDWRERVLRPFVMSATETFSRRQTLIPAGFKHMVNTLHKTGKFRPFVAMMLMGWMRDNGTVEMECENRTEAIPDRIQVRQDFATQFPSLVTQNLDAMYEWSKKPLKGIFVITVLARKVTHFLEDSFEFAFGSREIPWAAVSSEPNKYYDTTAFTLPFTPGGPTSFTRQVWDALGSAFASKAGSGSTGFFRKLNEAAAEQELEDIATGEAEAEHIATVDADCKHAEAEREGEHAEADATHVGSADAERERVSTVDADRKRAEAERERVAIAEAEAAHIASTDAERKRLEAEAEAEAERDRIATADANRKRVEAQNEVPEKRASKRKAEAQLVPEPRRTGRARQTPEDASTQRQQRAAKAATGNKPRAAVLMNTQLRKLRWCTEVHSGTYVPGT
ncbi:hypothetical protein DFH07DRAFT_764352 [Mycena maculata]|uniref:Uncharacterized protein n=1 Tax=Mycena maculata TaxID=230809 RepID=A0AAD7KG71_9AGAR|nr:hypothetical protein DFH07DRAFT_764352 [Mycena maculata]